MKKSSSFAVLGTINMIQFKNTYYNNTYNIINYNMVCGLVWPGVYIQLRTRSECTHQPVLIVQGWVTTRDCQQQILATHKQYVLKSTAPLSTQYQTNALGS